MNDIKITTRGGKLQFRPLETIEGSASWNLAAHASYIEIRLLWFTRGRGTPDSSIVESSHIGTPMDMSDAPFRFRLPEAPHSFSGQLIALAWAIEVVVVPVKGKERITQRLEFRMSPFESEIVLPVVEKPMSNFEKRAKQRAEAVANRMMSGRVQQ